VRESDCENERWRLSVNEKANYCQSECECECERERVIMSMRARALERNCERGWGDCERVVSVKMNEVKSECECDRELNSHIQCLKHTYIQSQIHTNIRTYTQLTHSMNTSISYMSLCLLQNLQKRLHLQ